MSAEHKYQDLNKYEAQMERPTRLGEALTIVGHPFAEPVTNQGLLNLALAYGLPQDQREAARAAIDATGFTTRYFSHTPARELDINSTVDRSVEIGSILLKEAMKAHGWDGIDVFIDTAAFLPASINKRVLDAAGINPDLVVSRSYRYACAGGIGAFIDTVADPELADARVVIAALEPLSVLVDMTKYLSPEGLSFPSIFGDAFTAIAFEPKRFRLDVKDTLVIPDGGVIKLKTQYDFSGLPSDPEQIPSHYRFAEGGREMFKYSKDGAFLDLIPTSDDKLVAMDGVATGLFFGNQTTGVIESMLKAYGDSNLLRKLGGKNIIMHPASKPVVDRIAKLLRRGGYLDTAQIPFLMKEARQSNGSSATTFNRLRYMIENNLVDPTLPVVLIAPGIGSVIAGAIGTINLTFGKKFL